MVTTILDVAVLNAVAELKGVSVDRINPVYDQMRLRRLGNAVAYDLNIASICQLVGYMYRNDTDVNTVPNPVFYPKLIYGDVDTPFDVYFPNPANTNASSIGMPLLFDKISFPVNDNTARTLYISFIRFDVI